MALSEALAELAAAQYVSLTTLRRSGEAVSTPVWIASTGDALVVTTTRQTGKAKRIKNTPRVQLRPCNRSGHVADGAPVVAARATVHADEATRVQAHDALRAKYGLLFRVFGLVMARRRADGVILSIVDG